MATDPLDVVAPVHLLVLGVGAVVTAAEGQQAHVLVGRLLQGQRDGDAASLADQVGLLLVD